MRCLTYHGLTDLVGLRTIEQQIFGKLGGVAFGWKLRVLVRLDGTCRSLGRESWLGWFRSGLA